ncbi:isoamyl alcohol oxidase [Aspergillus sclerotialis]|uniref:Isoamyl alcohol oxidase n=1 Tax=Aspergillus sclerotialis TaxID=2070753 RepID=A0A3A2ZEV2_9EURO|nr:isoamyl alcohol oxidase [Aspergillus sclerotialis]
MAPWFANFSCSPFSPPDTPCTVGPLPWYAVNASNAEDVRKTVKFTTTHNIRLVIRSTGHDYLGKSTGAGAVSIWTHHLKDIDFLHYHSPRYTGPAMRIGAGVQGMEAMADAHCHGIVLVTGNCPTVGITGGYTQGGGHGQLVSRFGLAADQVLEWEVLTASGKVLVASPSRNSDLYWALCGGGGSTYAIVLSMTVKVYPELRTTAATLSFTSAGVSGDTFWSVIREFITGILPLIDAGGVAVWLATETLFTVTPVTIPGGDMNQLEGGLRSTIDMLKHYNMTYNYDIREFPSFWASYQEMNPPSNITEFQLGGRLMPRSTIENNTTALINSLQKIIQYGAIVSGISLNVSRILPPDNAVNPAWRDTGIHITLGTPFDYTNRDIDIANQKLMTNTLVPLLEALSPNGGAYLNEADWNQADWQWNFYGRNYQKLEKIKDKYDPHQIFYGLTAVGSERWVEQMDGRLCRSK